MEKRKNDEYPSSNNNKKTKEDTIYKIKMPRLSAFVNDRLKYLFNAKNTMSDLNLDLPPEKFIEIPLRMDLITKPIQSIEDYIIDDVLWVILSYFDSLEYISIGQLEILCSVCKRWDKIIRSKNIYEKYYLNLFNIWTHHINGYCEIPKGSLVSCISHFKKEDSILFLEFICKRILRLKDNMLCKVLDHMPNFMLNDNSETIHQQNTDFKINDFYDHKSFKYRIHNIKPSLYFKAFEFIDFCMIYAETSWGTLFNHSNLDLTIYNESEISSIKSSIFDQCISSKTFRECCVPQMKIERYSYTDINIGFIHRKIIGKMLNYDDWPKNGRFLKDILKLASYKGGKNNGDIVFKFLKNGRFNFERIIFANQPLIEFIITNPNTTITTTQKICKYFKGKYDHLVDMKGNQMKILTFAKINKKITKEQFFSIALQDRRTKEAWNLFSDEEKSKLFPKWKKYKRED
jgi:hypothetical protein